MTQRKNLLDAFKQPDAGPLANFRKTDVVHKAITDYDRKKFKEYRKGIAKELVIGTGTLVAGALSINPIARGVITAGKGIRKAYKMAGSIGNTKKPDTVGNRMRQSQAILGVKKNESGTRIARNYGHKIPTSYTGGVIGTFKERKIGRTIQKAVEQGPNKFFSSGRSAKTGITPFKRAKDRFYIYGNLSTKEIKAQANPSTSKGSSSAFFKSLFENKTLKKSVEEANKKAREALKKK